MKREDEECPWESGKLGRDARYARAVKDDGAVDRALGLVKVTFRVDLATGRRLARKARKAGLCVQAFARQALVEKLKK